MKTDLVLQEKTAVSRKIGVGVVLALSAFLVGSFGLIALKAKPISQSQKSVIVLPDGSVLSTQKAASAQQQEEQAQFAPGRVLVKFKKGDDVATIVTMALADEQTLVIDKTLQPVYDEALKNELKLKNIPGYKTAVIRPTLKKISALAPQISVQHVKKFPDREKRGAKNQTPSTLDQWKIIEVNEQNIDIQQLVNAFQKQPGVETAEPDHVVKLAYLPNDYYLNTDLRMPPVYSWGQNFPDLWGIKRIHSPEAWDTERGDPSIVVAVIDTGTDTNHEDLVSNIWKNSGEDANGNCILDPGEDLNSNGILESGETCNGRETNGIDDDQNGYIDDVSGGNYNSSGDTHDTQGHGSHVAGTIAGRMDNTVGVSGVCGTCKIMTFVALPGGSGYDSWIVAGINYAVENGADVINMSIGGGRSSAEEDAVTMAYSNGVVVVAAAGNENSSTPSYPGSCEHAIGVAATAYGDQRASFSNFGDWVDIAAPGVDILSVKGSGTSMCSSSATVGGIYCHVSGTSMASPHVAGAAALALSANPALTVDDVRDVLRLSADDLTVSPFSQGFDPYSGWGIVNAARAVQLAGEITASPKADLLLQRLDVSFHWPNQVVVKGDVKNVGRIGTGSAVAFKVQSGATTYASGMTPGPLGVNGSYPFTLQFAGSSDLAYTVSVDPNNDIAEYSEANNTASAQPLLASMQGWPVKVNKNITSAPVVADLDMDGSQETIVADFNGNITPFRADGTLMAGWWPHATGPSYATSGYGSVTVGDFDPTVPGLEITYMTQAGKFYAWHQNGQSVAGWPRYPTSENTTFSYETPTLADINNDGILEMLGTVIKTDFGLNPRGVVIALRFDEAPVSGWETPKELGNNIYATTAPSVADVRPDIPGQEVFVAANDGKVYAWQADGAPLAGWPQLTAPGNTILYASVALADLSTQSSGLEVIVPAVSTTTGTSNVYVWRADGTVLHDEGLGWPRQIAYRQDLFGKRCFSPVVADIDPSYPGPEVVDACMESLTVKAWHADGVPVSGWDPAIRLPGGTDEQILSAPSIADLDGDGRLEVIIGPTQKGLMYIWRWNAQPFPTMPIRVLPSGSYFSETTVGDVNQDGKQELMVASNGGTVHAWSMQNPSTVTPLPWPARHQNPQNTGQFGFSMPDIPTISVSVTLPAEPPLTVKGTVTLKAQTIADGYDIDHVTITISPPGQEATVLSPTLVPCGLQKGSQEQVGSTLTKTQCYEVTVSTVGYPDGWWAVQAQAVTTTRLIASTAWKSMVVDNIPFTVRFTNPIEGMAVKGTVALEAFPTVEIMGISFFDDEQVIGFDHESPYSVQWDTAAVADGAHTLKAEAHAPGEFVNATIQVTVDNTLPMIPANLRQNGPIIIASEGTPLKQGEGTVAGATIARGNEMTPPNDGGGGGVRAKLVPLTWNASTDTGSGVAGYKIYFCYQPAIGCTPSYVRDVGNVTTFSFPAGVLGQNYVFEVTAYDKAGNVSAHSNRLTVQVLQ